MRLFENYHLRRYAHPSSLRRTGKYASFLGISQALHLAVFKQPLKKPVFDHGPMGFFAAMGRSYNKEWTPL